VSRLEPWKELSLRGQICAEENLWTLGESNSILHGHRLGDPGSQASFYSFLQSKPMFLSGQET
jgi:hypothetical protein